MDKGKDNQEIDNITEEIYNQFLEELFTVNQNYSDILKSIYSDIIQAISKSTIRELVNNAKDTEDKVFSEAEKNELAKKLLDKTEISKENQDRLEKFDKDYFNTVMRLSEKSLKNFSNATSSLMPKAEIKFNIDAPPEIIATEEQIELREKTLKEFKDKIVKEIRRNFEAFFKIPSEEEETLTIQEKNSLIPQPDYRMIPLSKTIKAMFDPRNTLDLENRTEKALPMILADYPDGLINVGTEKKPMYNKLKVYFNPESLNEELIKMGGNPLTDLQYNHLIGLCSFICYKGNPNFEVPMYKALELSKGGPWSFSETEFLKFCFPDIKKPTKKQREEFRKSFDMFMGMKLKIDSTQQLNASIAKALREDYKRKKLDMDGFNDDLEYMTKNIAHSTDTEMFLYGRYRTIKNKNGTKSRIYQVLEFPRVISDLLVTKHFRTDPKSYHQLAEGKRTKGDNFNRLYDELLTRILNGNTLIKSGNPGDLYIRDNRRLLALNIENFIKKNNIEFTETNPRRAKNNWLNGVIKEINKLAKEIPFFDSVALYPFKRGLKRTHIVIGYRNTSNKLIANDKFREWHDFKKAEEKKEKDKKRKQKAKEEELKAQEKAETTQD